MNYFHPSGNPVLEPVIKISGITKNYGDRCVLDIARLDINRGDIFSIVGPSGAGKSTLLKLLNFLEPPTTGEIEFEGEVFDTRGEMPLSFRRKITTVFQRPMLLDRSVYENVAYGLKLRGQREIRKLVNEVLKEVGLSQLSTQRAKTLSGGEAQRVALARAMVVKPVVLLLDEPTANLDPYNISLIENIILHINKEFNTTLVLVTHNIFQAHRVAKQVAFMLDGKIVEFADKEKFFNFPKDPRTKAFINGDMIY